MSESPPLRPAVSSTIESGSSCPECDREVPTVGVDEGCCPDCDVVVEPSPITREARPIYDHQDWQSKSRCGRRSTFLRSDDGLGVGVSWDERDWEKTKTNEAYRLDYAFGEIERMASALELPRPEREEAGRLFRLCHREELVVGRSMEGFATACLLAAIRNSSRCQPVLKSELERASRATSSQLRNARGAIACYLDGVSIPPLRPETLAPRVASDLDAPPAVRRLAGEIIRAYTAGGHGHSISPRTVVGAAFHAAYDVADVDERPRLPTVASAVEVAPSTVSTRKSDVLECYEQHSVASGVDGPRRGKLESR